MFKYRARTAKLMTQIWCGPMSVFASGSMVPSFVDKNNAHPIIGLE